MAVSSRDELEVLVSFHEDIQLQKRTADTNLERVTVCNPFVLSGHHGELEHRRIQVFIKTLSNAQISEHFISTVVQ